MPKGWRGRQRERDPERRKTPFFSPFGRGEQSEARRENNGEDYREREAELNKEHEIKYNIWDRASESWSILLSQYY